MKFSAAHFVAFRGFREPVHGHNYTVGLRVGSGTVQHDGYIVDFGELKKVARKACRELNSRTLIPMRSDVLTFTRSEAAPGQLVIGCEGGETISLPAKDCALLPIVHSTAEELAEYLFHTILLRDDTINLLLKRSVKWLEVTVSERPGQAARYSAQVTPALAASLWGKSGGEGKAPSAGNTTSVEAALAHEALVARAQAKAGARPTPRPCLASEDQDNGDPFCAEGNSAASDGTKPANPDIRQPGSDDKTIMPDHILEAEDAFRRLLATLGPSESGRPELERTPYRAAKAFHEMTRGIHWPDPRTAVGKGVFEVKSGPGQRDLVAVRDIPFHSLCEHHLLPFYGIAHVAYFPDGRVLGLSKFARLLEVFSRRLQLQERLTQQFVEALQEVLGPRAIAVAIEASHMCMSARGVQSPSRTRTLALRGTGKDEPILREALVHGVSFSHEHRARL